MKKTLIIIGMCVMLLSMPVLTAFPAAIANQGNISNQSDEKIISQTPCVGDYDGTFVGGIGRISKENGEWSFDAHGYLAGVYKKGMRFNKLHGKIYDLNEEQIGYIEAYFGHKIILGHIKDMQGHEAPIIGFLFYNDENFAGRIMSFFGPAPHVWGEYTPN